MNEDDEGSLPIGLASLPDQILPSQFFDMCGSHRFDDPEKRLKLAVLADAIRCWRYPSHSCKAKRARWEAERWLFDKFPITVFSFDGICEALGVDPDWLRKGLRRWQGGVSLTPRAVVNIGRRTYPTPDREPRRRHRRPHLPSVPV